MKGTASRVALFAVIAAAIALAGCSGPKVVASTLTLDQRSPSSPTPEFYVNVTSQDFQVYPALEKLIRRWETENMNGSYAGFSISYPYGDGLAIVRSLEERVPGAYWSPGSVVIAYEGFFFDLTAIAPPHADG